MFESRVTTSSIGSAIRTAEIIYTGAVRHVRQSHGNPVLGLVITIIQACLMLAMFYLMLTIFGARGMAVRGDFVVFLMSGIFIFLTHNMAVGAVLNSESPVSGLMMHTPMNTFVAICSAALGTLYTQTLALICVLSIYHLGFKPITVEEPILAYLMLVLGWASGCAVGLVFLGIKPWFPRLSSMGNMVYRRMNMIASGKMFTANSLPGSMIAIFDWNPLFHCIDQSRGFVFLNYNPRVTSITYPIVLTLTLVIIGMLGEYYARRNLSLSYSAGK